MRVDKIKLHSKYLQTGIIAKRIKSKVVSNPTVQTAVISTAAASAIAAVSLVKPFEISEKIVKEKLTQKGYQKNSEGNLCILRLSDEQKNKIYQRYGDKYTQSLVWKIENEELEPKDLKNFTDFINIDKKLGKEMFDKHFDNLYNTYLILKSQNRFGNINEKFKNNKDIYKLVYNIVTADFDKELVDNINKWKGKSNIGDAGTAQELLRENFGHYGARLPESAQNFTNKMSKIIDTQTLPETITLYRREGMEVLKDVKLADGKHVNLAQMMKEVANEKNPDEKLKQLKEFILDNEISTIQPAFMSTSIDKDLMTSFRGPQGHDGGEPNVIWTFNVMPKTKGLYIEGLNASNTASSEQEVLLQKGSKIELENIEYNKYHDLWKINAKVSN